MNKHFGSSYLYMAIFTIFLLISFPCTAMSSSSDTNISIDFRTSSLVKNEKVFIGDLAVVHAEKALKEKIENIKVAPSPGPGKEKVITGKRVASIIRSVKWVPKNTRIGIPEFIWVKRASQTIPDTALKDLFCRYIEKNIGTSEYRLSKFRIQGKKDYITGNITLLVRESESQDTVSGQMKLLIIVKVDEKEQGKVKLSGWIDRFEYAVCAARFLPKGTILDESHLQKKLMNISKAPSNIVKNYNKAMNNTLRRSLRPGEYLRANMLENPVIIKRGEMIKLIAKSGMLTVVAYGTAQNDGALGEQIKVENSDTSRTVVGRVVNASSVEVVF
jgi:flagellar basal body P-ring formation protein FlgA